MTVRAHSPQVVALEEPVGDVIAIPGHHPAHLAYYDRRTGILLTGDHLYPGRLYVDDLATYLASTRRLVEFTATRPVAHILGNHIEQTSTPYLDYPVGILLDGVVEHGVYHAGQITLLRRALGWPGIKS